MTLFPFSTHMVQDPLPKEWFHSQGASLPTPVNMIKIIPHRRAHPKILEMLSFKLKITNSKEKASLKNLGIRMVPLIAILPADPDLFSLNFTYFTSFSTCNSKYVAL